MAQRRGELVRRVGERLREMREAKGATQEEVAERAGYSAKYVSEIERGLRDPPLTTLDRIVTRGLGCQLADVFVGVGVRANPLKRDLRPALPRGVQRFADDLAELPNEPRRQAIAALRAVLALAKTRLPR